MKIGLIQLNLIESSSTWPNSIFTQFNPAQLNTMQSQFNSDQLNSVYNLIESSQTQFSITDYNFNLV